MNLGCKYGTHRVIEPKGALPQSAIKLNNNLDIYDNEILIDVHSLNIDSASFTQIIKEQNNDIEAIAKRIIQIVAERGKMQNPVTGSGGMLIGSIEKIGRYLKDKIDLRVGDKIATLVSLSLTPLKIEKIIKINSEIHRVAVKGKAILFESGIYAKLPNDMDENLALAALDVAGAPAQTAKLVKPGDSVLILGASGKSGILCCYEAMKRVGPSGRVIGVVRSNEGKTKLKDLDLCHEIITSDARDALDVLSKALNANNNKEYDISINCVNVSDTEMSSILPVKNCGVVYFFSMATSFSQAALGAEGVGKDVTMILGNGYTKGHSEITLEELRECDKIRKLFENIYK